MTKNSIYVIVVLTLVWVILSENVSLLTVATGIVLGAACELYCRKYLPFGSITGVKFLTLSLYPIYLIGQIYLAGFNAIKLLLTGSRMEIVEIKTNIKHNLLRVALANSITLTPGTIALRLEDDTITVLWLRKKETLSPDTDISELIKGNLEKRLIKAER